jgi:hypothetical protein
VGVVTLWDEAPVSARAAIVVFEGREHEAPARNGYFLFAAWESADDAAHPRFVRWIT